jgi:hypothetical protein
MVLSKLKPLQKKIFSPMFGYQALRKDGKRRIIFSEQCRRKPSLALLFLVQTLKTIIAISVEPHKEENNRT